MCVLRMLLLLLALNGARGAEGPDLARFVDGALRRVSAAGAVLPRIAAKRTSDSPRRWLDAHVGRIEPAIAALGPTPALPALAAAAADLRVIGLFARFRARWQLTAVHYNLFRWQLKLTENVRGVPASPVTFPLTGRPLTR